MSEPRSLYAFFAASVERAPTHPALEVDGEILTYAQLQARAAAIAATLVRARANADGSPRAKLTAALVHRSASGFAGILGVLGSGHGYVPMLPSLPPARLALMIARADAPAVVVDAEGQAVVGSVLALLDSAITVVAVDADAEAVATLRGDHPRHTILGRDDLASPDAFTAPEVGPDDVAYLLFTSGSTGEPKGVMVAQRNIARFLDVVIDRYALTQADRFSHLFEITFDLSLFDLFAAWRVGGCLCVPDMKQRLLPARYAVDSRLSVWFSVPSAALLMKRMRTLVPDSLANLRVALFCGEALPVTVVESFVEAAPNAIVENIYGPTELTLACTHYRWTPDSAAEAENDVVPIGDPFAGMRAKVVDADLVEVAPGQTGELIMSGPQTALGYRNDPERTAAAFMVPPGETEIFYRTGDRVRRPAHDGAPMTFLGRMDSQIKINGYRVELGEIEAVLQREAGVDAAVALGWPETPGGASGVVGFIVADASDVDVDALIERMAVSLPKYMVPRDVLLLAEFPLNANGKIDRKALRATLK